MNPHNDDTNKCVKCGAPILSDEPVSGQPCLDCIMESDLIERLHAVSGPAALYLDHTNECRALCGEAADKIVRLRAAVAMTTGQTAGKLRAGEKEKS